MNKQETIGAKGTVPGFRPLIGEERWCNGDFNLGSLIGGFRPFLESETQNGDWGVTRSPLPPPAVETFEAHGHIWYKHTPGDECPVEPDAKVDVLWPKEMAQPFHYDGNYTAIRQNWNKEPNGESVIGYRFPDYPAVHATSHHVEKTEQSFQHCAPQPTATITTQFSTEQRLTSLYNDWCFLPPETVDECIADVASVLYPTDAGRCEAAFHRWWTDNGFIGDDKVTAGRSWHAAWKAAKESKA